MFDFYHYYLDRKVHIDELKIQKKSNIYQRTINTISQDMEEGVKDIIENDFKNLSNNSYDTSSFSERFVEFCDKMEDGC